jgi:hypothetical protein
MIKFVDNNNLIVDLKNSIKILLIKKVNKNSILLMIINQQLTKKS